MKKQVVAIVICMILSMLTAMSCMAQNDDFVSGIKWDAEYDVVVIGYGMAGATAAVTAAENGANVLIVEKAAPGHEGGNSRYAGQCILTIDQGKRDDGLAYIRALRGKFDTPSDAIIDVMVDGFYTNVEWLEAHGAEGHVVPVFSIEYPELPGAGNGPYVLYDGEFFTGKWYKFFQKLVEEQHENIDVWYEAPATHLIQDKETKVVHGVTIENNGQEYNVFARNGVVMALGGFENNQVMLQNYTQLSDAYSKGARYNTGDGIKMAIEVGANLWHMSALSGPDVNFINPETNVSMGYALSYCEPYPWATGFLANDVIYIGGSGERFIDETCETKHGHNEVAGTFFSIHIPEYAYCVFDEDARLKRNAYYSWSDGMVEEIEKGWVVKGDTIEELAEKINVDPQTLVKTINNYNSYCEAGYDPDFKRNPEYMQPLDNGPYYAFEVHPTLTNTQGGAERNEKCEVVDPYGEPIPHLYSAGQFGSFWADIYQGGGNMGECLFTGRIAGENAAAAKADAVTVSVLGDKAPLDFSAKEIVYDVAANEYIGTGNGIGGEVKVKVTVEDDKIAAAEIVLCNETPGLGDQGMQRTLDKILEAQSTEVDTMTGATVSSKATIEAVNDALAQSKM